MEHDPFLIDADVVLGVEMLGTREKGDVRISEVSLPSPNQAAPAAIYLRPKREGKFPLVLYSHWLAPEVDANKTQFLAEAETLSGEGYACLLVDTVFADWPKSRMNWTGQDSDHDRRIIIDQVRELRSFLRAFRSRPEIDPERIALVGHDFGGMFNAILVGLEGGIKACAIMAAIPDFADWFTLETKMDEGHKRAYYQALADLAPKDYLRLATTPAFLFQFGTKDRFFVPTERAELLVASAGGAKEVRWYDSDHDLHRNSRATEDRVGWIKRSLG